jgi:acyl transferase domain-containing protein
LTLFTNPGKGRKKYSLAKSLLALGVEPDYVLGTSLGEFTAAAIAGVFDVQKTLELIIFQATCFERICAQGRMLAVLDNHTHYENCSVLVNNSSLVAVNFENHFVISGFVNNLQLIENYFKEKRILCQRLPVSFGFHSANIDPARELFIKQKIISSFQIPNIKNISSFNKKQIQNIDINHLWNVVREPILFRETIIELVNKNPQLRFIDLSPSGTLATFLKYILGNNSKNCEIMPTMTLFDNELQNVSILKTVNT